MRLRNKVTVVTGAGGGFGEAIAKRYAAEGAKCEPEDMSSAALWLASDEAEFITGVELPVDGGRTI